MNPAYAWVVGRQEEYKPAAKVKYNELVESLIDTIGDILGKG